MILWSEREKLKLSRGHHNWNITVYLWLQLHSFTCFVKRCFTNNTFTYFQFNSNCKIAMDQANVSEQKPQHNIYIITKAAWKQLKLSDCLNCGSYSLGYTSGSVKLAACLEMSFSRYTSHQSIKKDLQETYLQEATRSGDSAY